ncbi:uncharacterized protein LOC128128877 [Lactuca sativa]|uniref:uncharacterized protein LOC128128877 n=1 Tax=Lactuca sativa TaxID=4236 RepID=UPI0022AEF346|nr:uncharacterized protein LOC128128877 [Lactuca sativa]
MEQNQNTSPSSNPNTTSSLGFAGYEDYFNLLSTQGSQQIPYQGAAFSPASPPLQFPNSHFFQQNQGGQNPNLQQNLFPSFASMQQQTNQPSPTTQQSGEAEAGGSRNKKGKGKGKSKGKSIAVESENANVPHWWTPEEEYALTAALCATSKDELRGNGMKKGAYWGAVLDKFHAILKKNLYRNDMLSSKWSMISKRCSKFNGIYNRIAAQQQSGTNDFDLFKAAKEQYRVEMGHVFDFEKSWELLRADPKWNKTHTSSEVQSKRSRNSSSVDVSDARTNRPKRR